MRLGATTPTFAAPVPVAVALDVPFGVLEVRASQRDDLVVTVTPTDPAKSGSVRAAEAITVDRDGDTLRIVYPGSWTQYVPGGECLEPVRPLRPSSSSGLRRGW